MSRLNNRKLKMNNRKLNNLKGSEAVKSMVTAGYDKRKAIKILLKVVKEVNSTIPSKVRLDSMFAWHRTKQGHDFWSNIFYQKGLNND